MLADHVKCNNCNEELYVEVCEEKCFNCGMQGALMDIEGVSNPVEVSKTGKVGKV